MANLEQLDLLKQGVEIWNQWREEHPDRRPDLSGVDLMGADLHKADLHEADLSSANLRGANLRYAWLARADLRSADLGNAPLRNAYLSGADLRSADLSYADLSYADFRDADFRDADLHGAYLHRADLNRANLSGANLSGANLMGVDLMGVDLMGVDLNRARLGNANLSGANLSGADLSYADLRDAYLHGANLSRANLNRARLGNANLFRANLSGADLSYANLNRANLVETNLSGATLTQCSVYGISVWDVQLEGAKQESLVITREGEPMIKVDDLEVAQFIYLLLNHKKLRNVLNAVTERGVLILGRFGGGGLEVLQAIAAKLREEGYLPILFDFERPRDQDYTETIMTLAGLSHFIIADLSGPSVPQELSHTVPFHSTPLVPIIEKGKKTYSMFPDFMKYPWVIKPPINFRTIEQLQQLIPTKIIPLAEKKQQNRQKQLEKLFPQKQGGEDKKLQPSTE